MVRVCVAREQMKKTLTLPLPTLPLCDGCVQICTSHRFECDISWWMMKWWLIILMLFTRFYYHYYFFSFVFTFRGSTWIIAQVCVVSIFPTEKGCVDSRMCRKRKTRIEEMADWCWRRAHDNNDSRTRQLNAIIVLSEHYHFHTLCHETRMFLWWNRTVASFSVHNECEFPVVFSSIASDNRHFSLHMNGFWTSSLYRLRVLRTRIWFCAKAFLCAETHSHRMCSAHHVSILYA